MSVLLSSTDVVLRVDATFGLHGFYLRIYKSTVVVLAYLLALGSYSEATE